MAQIGGEGVIVRRVVFDVTLLQLGVHAPAARLFKSIQPAANRPVIILDTIVLSNLDSPVVD